MILHHDVKSSRGMPSSWFFFSLINNKLMQTYLILISWAEPSEASQTWEGKTQRGVGGPGLASVAEPRSGVQWGAQGQHCHTWTEESNTPLQPPSCCLCPPTPYCCLQTKTAHHLNFPFSSLFCIKFIGLWFLAHERFIPSSFFPYESLKFPFI